MLQLSYHQRYHLFLGNTNTHKGVDGLSGIATNLMKQHLSGVDIFIYVNCKCIHIKLPEYEEDAFAIYYKCLAKGL